MVAETMRTAVETILMAKLHEANGDEWQRQAKQMRTGSSVPLAILGYG